MYGTNNRGGNALLFKVCQVDPNMVGNDNYDRLQANGIALETIVPLLALVKDSEDLCVLYDVNNRQLLQQALFSGYG